MLKKIQTVKNMNDMMPDGLLGEQETVGFSIYEKGIIPIYNKISGWDR
jgi:hypothetical protein